MTNPAATTPRKRFRAGLYLGVAFITTIFVALATFAAVRAFQPSRSTLALIPIADRQPSPFSMPTLDGKPWSTQDHLGQVILLNYFATWCPPCREESPDLKQIAAGYGPRGVTLAAVSLDTDAEGPTPRVQTLAGFNAIEKLPFPILLPAADSPLLRDITEIPQTVLLDRRGKIALHITGKTDARELASFLDQLLKE